MYFLYRCLPLFPRFSRHKNNSHCFESVLDIPTLLNQIGSGCKQGHFTGAQAGSKSFITEVHRNCRNHSIDIDIDFAFNYSTVEQPQYSTF